MFTPTLQFADSCIKLGRKIELELLDETCGLLHQETVLRAFTATYLKILARLDGELAFARSILPFDWV